MSFSNAAITPVGGQSLRGKAPQVFAYKTTDALSTVKGSGYFNSFGPMLEPGDLILVSTMSSGSATNCYILTVAAKTSGTVTTAVAAYTAAS